MKRTDAVERATPWALAAAVSLVYGATVSAPVFGDDRVFVEGASIFGLPFKEFLGGVLSRGYLIFTQEGTYQPLVTVFHYAAHGHPAFYRAVGLALHALNAWLVYRVARTLKGSHGNALLAAFLFALFPANAETLVVSSFKGHILAFTFTLAALLSWARALEKHSRPALPATFAFSALAFTCKQTGVLIPFFLAAYSWLYARKKSPDLQRRAGLGFALAAVCYLWWRFEGLETGAMPVSPHSPSLLFGWYAKELLWPYPVCRERMAPVSPAWHLFTAAFVAAAWAARRRPGILFGLILASVGLLPHIHRAQYYFDSPVADRFLYTASAGFALALSFAAEAPGAAAALAAVALVWGGIAFERNLLYRDTRKLYEQTTVCAPDHFKAWGVLAAAQLDAGEYAAAQENSRKALTLNGYFPAGISILRRSSLALGDEEQARDADKLEALLFPPEPSGTKAR